MNLHQKKKLAEWMRWSVHYDNRRPEGKEMYFKPDDNTFINADEWSPDRNHVQFGKVWGKLSHEQKIKIVGSWKYLSDLLPEERILLDTPGAMKDVLEVLGIEEK